MMSRTVRAYSLMIGLGGAVSVATLPLGGAQGSIVTLLALAALSAIAGTMSVSIPRLRVEITPGDAFVFAALMVVGPFAAAVTALAGGLGAMVGPNRRPLSICTIFNLGTMALAASAAGWTYTTLLGAFAGPTATVAALFGAVAAYFLVNTFLVAGVFRLHTGTPFLQAWSRTGLWTLPSSLANGLLALGLASMLAATGPIGLIVGLVGCVTIAGSYKLQRIRKELEQLVAEGRAAEEQALEQLSDVVEETGELADELAQIVADNSPFPLAENEPEPEEVERI